MNKPKEKKPPEKKEVGRPEKPVHFEGSLEDMINIAIKTPAPKKTK
jgi:hypothetical protein